MTSRLACLLAHLMVLLMLACGTAGAADLYQAQAIVTGEGEENRKVGFARALEQVLVKVSGDPRLASEPAVAAMGAQAGTFVAEFGYRDRMAGIPVHDEQGTRDRPFDLTVDFIPEKIEAALRSLGRDPWTATRPRIVVFLGVQNGPTAYTLAGDGERGRDLRDALAAEAGRLGLPALLPDEAALAAAGLSLETLPAAYLASLDEMAKSAGGDVALAGGLVWSDAALGWIADWRLAWHGKTYRWQIGGVSFDAAFRNGLGGAAQILAGHGPPS
jgi:hypothetical protein